MKRLLLGISSGVLYSALSIVVGLVTAPYFLKFLSKEEYGLFYLLNNTVVWTGILNAGLRGGFKVQLSTYVSKGLNTDKLKSTLFFAQCFVAFLVGCIGCCASFFLPYFFRIPDLPYSEIHYIFILLSASFACSFISNGLSLILSVYNKDLHIYTVRSFQVVIQAIFTALLLAGGYEILSLALSAIISEVFFLIYIFYLAKNKFGLANPAWTKFDKGLLKESMSLGKWFAAGFLAQLLLRHTDLFLVAHFSSVDKVISFIFTAKLYWLVFALFQTANKVISPQLIQLVQGKNYSFHAENMKLLFFNLSTCLTVAAGSGIFFFNSYLIEWWLGKGFYLGKDIDLMLMLTFIFTCINLTITTLQTANLEWRRQKMASLTEGVLHLFFAVVLGWHWGVEGLSVGIALASIAGCVVSIIPFLRKNSTLQLSGSYSKSLLRFLAVSVISIAAVYLLPSFLNSMLWFCLIILSFTVLFMKEIRAVALKIVKN